MCASIQWVWLSAGTHWSDADRISQVFRATFRSIIPFINTCILCLYSSALWYSWLGIRKSTWPIKTGKCYLLEPVLICTLMLTYCQNFAIEDYNAKSKIRSWRQNQVLGTWFSRPIPRPEPQVSRPRPQHLGFNQYQDLNPRFQDQDLNTWVLRPRLSS